MKQRKLSPIQASALIRTLTGISRVVYEPNQALAYATVNDKNYCLVYDNELKFTGLAHRLFS